MNRDINLNIILVKNQTNQLLPIVIKREREREEDLRNSNFSGPINCPRVPALTKPQNGKDNPEPIRARRCERSPERHRGLKRFRSSRHRHKRIRRRDRSYCTRAKEEAISHGALPLHIFPPHPNRREDRHPHPPLRRPFPEDAVLDAEEGAAPGDLRRREGVLQRGAGAGDGGHQAGVHGGRVVGEPPLLRRRYLGTGRDGQPDREVPQEVGTHQGVLAQGPVGGDAPRRRPGVRPRGGGRRRQLIAPRAPPPPAVGGRRPSLSRC